MAHFFGYIVTASLAFYLGRFRADRSQIRIKYIQALLLRSRRVIRLLVKQLEIATRRRKKIVTMSDADRRAILRLMNTLPAPVSKRFLFIIQWKTAVRWHKKLSKWFHRILIWNGRRKSRKQVSKGPGRPPRYLEEYPYIFENRLSEPHMGSSENSFGNEANREGDFAAHSSQVSGQNP